MTQQVWFITGASKGFGLEISKAVLAAGDKVVATARNPQVVKKALGKNDRLSVLALDVIDEASPSDVVTRDAEVATMYKRYLDVVLDNRATVALVTWGLTDRDSWITRGDDPSFRRADGLPARPLPFDDHYARKPAYYAVAEALKAAPAR